MFQHLHLLLLPVRFIGEYIGQYFYFMSKSTIYSLDLSHFFEGVVQGIVTGIRGLCNGIGPALYGLIFYLFHVDLSDKHSQLERSNSTMIDNFDSDIVSVFLVLFLSILFLC